MGGEDADRRPPGGYGPGFEESSEKTGEAEGQQAGGELRGQKLGWARGRLCTLGLDFVNWD